MGKSQQWSWAVSIFLLLLVLGLYKCIYTLYELCLGFLQSCSQSHWFSNKLRRFVLSVFNPRTGVPNMRLNLLTPQRGPSNLYNHCPLLCPLQEVQAPNWLLAFPSFQTQCKSYLETATENSLSLSLLFFFSENSFTCGCIFDVFIEGRWIICPPIPPSWSLMTVNFKGDGEYSKKFK